MAESYSLKSFQESLAQRLREASTEAVPDSRLAVEAGGGRWLLQLNQAGEVLPMSALGGSMASVPLTRPWYLGLANVRGNLVGVVDFAQFAGGAPASVTAATRIVLLAERFQFHCALLVDRLVGLRNRERLGLAAEPAAGAPAWQGAQLRDRDGLLWQELDVVALMADERFLTVGRLSRNSDH